MWTADKIRELSQFFEPLEGTPDERLAINFMNNITWLVARESIFAHATQISLNIPRQIYPMTDKSLRPYFLSICNGPELEEIVYTALRKLKKAGFKIGFDGVWADIDWEENNA